MRALAGGVSRLVGALCIVGTGAGPMASFAGDRPFLATASAAAEEDNDAVWAVESAFQRLAAVRSLGVAIEYAIDPTNALQVEFSRTHDREAGATELGMGLEYKHLFNRIARDGYGYGMVAALDFARPQSAGWQGVQWSLTLPLSVQLGEPSTLLHLNLGVSKPRAARREWTASAAFEHEIAKRTVLFAEVARQGDGTLMHGGVRYWVRKERFALDLSLQRLRGDVGTSPGVIVGFGWYDL
jgi:hypothetical protein